MIEDDGPDMLGKCSRCGAELVRGEPAPGCPVCRWNGSIVRILTPIVQFITSEIPPEHFAALPAGTEIGVTIRAGEPLGIAAHIIFPTSAESIQ
jgi:hypothetical protein